MIRWRVRRHCVEPAAGSGRPRSHGAALQRTRPAHKKQNQSGAVATSSFPLWGKAGLGATRRDRPPHPCPHLQCAHRLASRCRSTGSAQAPRKPRLTPYYPPPAGEGATTFLRERRVPTGAWEAHKKQTPGRPKCFSPPQRTTYVVGLGVLSRLDDGEPEGPAMCGGVGDGLVGASQREPGHVEHVQLHQPAAPMASVTATPALPK